VVHLAAQAGVRYSLANPHAYTESNIEGFINILEGCRLSNIEHLVYASSSSVYGGNTHMPFSTHDNVDHPVSLYAATKKANELMAHCYAHLYQLPCTGLRFFTVYGPWGRPDMALFIFTKAILEGKPIEVFNEGRMKRDFTYVDDIAEGVIRTLDHPAKADPTWSGDRPTPETSSAPARIYNIGNHRPVALQHFIEVLERALGKKAEKKLMPLQPGDVPATYADIDDLTRDVGFKPTTSIEDGIPRFVKWYREFYRV
jgi:UDP-glucuronate 4-epimerase